MKSGVKVTGLNDRFERTAIHTAVVILSAYASNMLLLEEVRWIQLIKVIFTNLERLENTARILTPIHVSDQQVFKSRFISRVLQAGK